MGRDSRAEFPQFGRRRVQLVLRPTDDAEVGADRREVAGDAEIDAAAAAGDEHGLALEQIFGEIGGDVHGAFLGWRVINLSSLSKIGPANLARFG